MKKYLFASTLFLASCVSTTNQKSTKPETITIDEEEIKTTARDIKIKELGV